METRMRTYRLEHDEQSALFTWANLSRSIFPDLEWMAAIPNGGHRNLLVARKMKAEGVKPGIPDVILPVARHGFHGLFLEMKTEANRPKHGGKGGCSDVQIRWHEALRDRGYKVAVCYGFEEARKTIVDYLQ